MTPGSALTEQHRFDAGVLSANLRPKLDQVVSGALLALMVGGTSKIHPTAHIGALLKDNARLGRVSRTTKRILV